MRPHFSLFLKERNGVARQREKSLLRTAAKRFSSFTLYDTLFSAAELTLQYAASGGAIFLCYGIPARRAGT